MASPNANTDKEGVKKGIKMTSAIHTMKNIIVFRLPNRSCAHAFRSRPANCPTTAELDRPDCQLGVITFLPGEPGTGVPKFAWNCSWPKKLLICRCTPVSTTSHVWVSCVRFAP